MFHCVNIICNLNFRRNFKTSQETKWRANGDVNVVSSVWGVNRLGLVRWFKLAFGLVRVLVCRHLERRRFGGNWSESGSIFGQTPGMVYIFFANVRSILVCLFCKSGIYPPYQIKSLKINKFLFLVSFSKLLSPPEKSFFLIKQLLYVIFWYSLWLLRMGKSLYYNWW